MQNLSIATGRGQGSKPGKLNRLTLIQLGICIDDGYRKATPTMTRCFECVEHKKIIAAINRASRQGIKL